MVLNDPTLANSSNVEVPGAYHDASSCSTAASEQSDRKKRSRSSSDANPNITPYECRFCLMKFEKSQALGGHMNRHRNEREREQVMNARQLLMQQEFSPTQMVLGQSSRTPLSKLGQSYIHRLTSDHSFKDGDDDGNGIGVPSIFGRGFLQSNPISQSHGGPSLSWSQANGQLESARMPIPTLNFDGMIPSYQACRTPPPFIMQPPLNRALNQHECLMSSCFEKPSELSRSPFDSDNPTVPQGKSFHSPPTQQSSQEGSILTGSPEVENFMSTTNLRFLQQRSKDFKIHEDTQPNLSEALSLQLIEEGGRPSLPTSNSISFNLGPGPGNVLDGVLSWLDKSTPTMNTFCIPTNKVDQQDLEQTESNVDTCSISVSSEPKIMKWD